MSERREQASHTAAPGSAAHTEATRVRGLLGQLEARRAQARRDAETMRYTLFDGRSVMRRPAVLQEAASRALSRRQTVGVMALKRVAARGGEEAPATPKRPPLKQRHIPVRHQSVCGVCVCVCVQCAQWRSRSWCGASVWHAVSVVWVVL